MIIDQLPVLASVQDTDEVPIERGTATYKAGVAAILKSATDAAEAAQTAATAAQTAATAAQEAVASKPGLETIYPIGSLYFSTASTNPATLFGFGTWQQIQDTFLLAAGSTYAAGTTGGEATHTLTVDEMPSHTHVYAATRTAASGTATFRPVSYGDSGATNINMSSTGGGAAHNNMPPYLAVYVWTRTA